MYFCNLVWGFFSTPKMFTGSFLGRETFSILQFIFFSEFCITWSMDSQIWSSLQAVRAEKLIWEFAMFMPGILTSSPFCWDSPLCLGTIQLMTWSLLCCQLSRRAFLTQVGRTFHIPVAMTTDWEETSRNYCCQGKICQSKELTEECWKREEQTKTTSKIGLWRKIMGGRGMLWWQSTNA